MKSYIKHIIPLSVLILLSLPEIAGAHNIGGNGFSSGIVHPLFGVDHLLAMVAVGIISTQMSKKVLWSIPLTFVLSMIIGGVLALSGVHLPIVETGIALSVLFLGTVIAFSRTIPTVFILMCVSIFAIFHGHAHGSEISVIANPAFYTIGFVLATTILHIIGIYIGHNAKKTTINYSLLRFCGSAMTIVGVFFLLT